MAIIGPEEIKALEEKGYRAFITLLKWEGADDGVAAQKMHLLHTGLGELGIEGGHAWYLTGKRTMVVIGWTNKNSSLQRLSAAITFGTGINADVCSAVNVHDLANIIPDRKA